MAVKEDRAVGKGGAVLILALASSSEWPRLLGLPGSTRPCAILFISLSLSDNTNTPSRGLEVCRGGYGRQPVGDVHQAGVLLTPLLLRDVAGRIHERRHLLTGTLFNDGCCYIKKRDRKLRPRTGRERRREHHVRLKKTFGSRLLLALAAGRGGSPRIPTTRNTGVLR